MIEETDSRVTIKIKEANRILSSRVAELDAKTDQLTKKVDYKQDLNQKIQ